MTAVFLTAQQVELIRRTLVEALELHGGSLDAETEPGLPEELREREKKLREAIMLLDRAVSQ